VNRVAKWLDFKPKITILEIFGGPWNRKYRHILLPFGICYGHFVYFTAFWPSLLLFGTFFSFGMFGARKIWQPWSLDRMPRVGSFLRKTYLRGLL
jgi:hypothetical protein